MECWQRRQRQQRRRRRRRRHAGLIRRRRRRNPSAKNAAKTRPRTQGALLPQEGEENFVYRSRILWHIRGKRKVLWPSIRPLTHPAAHRSPLRNLARLLHGEREREREHEGECERVWRKPQRSCATSRGMQVRGREGGDTHPSLQPNPRSPGSSFPHSHTRLPTRLRGRVEGPTPRSQLFCSLCQKIKSSVVCVF